MSTDIEHLVSLLSNAQEIVVFTGAGISTESGISDYRSKGGLWQRFQPVTIQEFQASQEKRKEYWVTKRELYESLYTAGPNEGHKAVVEIDRLGKLKGLITQNIDGLHGATGLDKARMVELHGTNLETICLSCEDLTEWRETAEELRNGVDVPLCKKCGGFLKPNTVSFGQSLRQHDLQQAFTWAQNCDLMLAVGSSLVVEPAASLPRLAKQSNARLVIITQSDTPLDGMADLKLTESCGVVLQKAVSQLL